MPELLGSIECDLEGNILKATGDFAGKDHKDITKNIFYIIQDVSKIQTNLTDTGNFIKIRIRCDTGQYEVAVGSSTLQINRYKPEI